MTEGKDPGDGYYEGMRRGVRLYAWWKDGIQYVGTSTALKMALAEIDRLEYAYLHTGYEPGDIR